LIDQEKIHKQCLSEDPEERIKALEQLKDNFSLFSDKQQAWNDLIRLTTYKDSSLRSRAVYFLRSVFYKLLGEQQSWNDIRKLIADEDSSVRSEAADALGSAFSEVPCKMKILKYILIIIDY